MAKATKKTEAAKTTATEEKGLTTQPKAGVPAVGGIESGWGGEGLHGSDLLVPKMLLMQGLSKLVADGAASPGQIRDSLTGDLFGGKTGKDVKPVEIIAFSSFRTWVIFEKKNGKDEYVKTIPITPENEGLAITEVVNGVEVRRDKCLNFYVLRPEDIKDGSAFPYLISFRRTSGRAGKKLATFAAKLRVFKKPLASKVMMLSVESMENDKGKFFGLDISQGRDSTPEEIKEAFQWHEALKTATVRVDDSDLKTETAASSAPTAQGGEADGIDY
jgi:hypothetical protein